MLHSFFWHLLLPAVACLLVVVVVVAVVVKCSVCVCNVDDTGLEHNSQCVAYHSNGKADVPCHSEACCQEAGDCVCAVAQTDAADCHRHPDILCCRHAAQPVPSHVRVEAGASAGEDDWQGEVCRIYTFDVLLFVSPLHLLYCLIAGWVNVCRNFSQTEILLILTGGVMCVCKLLSVIALSIAWVKEARYIIGTIRQHEHITLSALRCYRKTY